MPTPTEVFASDPLGFLAENIVNPAFRSTFVRVFQPEPVTFATQLGAMLDSGGFPVQDFQVVPLMIHTDVNYGLMPVPETYFSKPGTYNTTYPFSLLRDYPGVRGKSIEAQKALIEFCAATSKATMKKRGETGPVLRAYYFPYKIGMATEAEHMGYVDIPVDDPPFRFVFTGQMNGCHLVVTGSPVAGHFRAWHYQSPGNKPHFNKANFPGQPIYDWLTDAEYAGVVKNDEVGAFNFLHHDGSRWNLCSQPHQIVMGTTLEQKKQWGSWDTYIARPSTKKPFSRALSFD